MFSIFVVEDDRKVRDELVTLLRNNGYAATATEEFTQVPEAVIASAPDLLLLDLSLPMLDGQLVCQEIRRHSQLPIIVVTSRDNSMDELLALERGADDFIAKPYDPPILLAHIASLLRRSYSDRPEPAQVFAGVSLDAARSEASFEGRTTSLTKNELRILSLLMRHKGEIVSRYDIQAELWLSDEFVDDNTLTVNVNRLRATLAGIGVGDSFLQTRRGQGYLLHDPHEGQA
ncbi:MAG: response regulator transcription factor [Coriobacteriaceae bacterium]|jgi:DNA-binding response OmpR family regulator|nr:response regulator transcription factor [Coriobacteriaceae bacterium]